MKSKLTKSEQKLVAIRLVQEYTYLGVNLQGATQAVADGDWDDHPLALALRHERFLAVHMRDNKHDLL